MGQRWKQSAESLHPPYRYVGEVEAYKNLLAAVIEQGIKDYLEAYTTILLGGETLSIYRGRSAKGVMQEVEHSLQSPMFAYLDIDMGYLLSCGRDRTRKELEKSGALKYDVERGCTTSH